MSILSGSISSRRYIISNNADSATNPSNAGAALLRHAFPVSWEGAGVKTGWVEIDDLLGVGFDHSAWNVSPFYVFSMRLDTRQVPAPLLRAHLNKALDKWRLENGKRRVPRPVRNELRDTVTNELLPTVTPRSKMFDVLWDTRQNMVSFSGLSDAAAEHFVTLFQEAFNCSLEPEADQAPSLAEADTRDFFLWLWYSVTHGELETRGENGVDIRYAKRITLTDETGDEVTTVVGGADGAAEARKAASAGKRPSNIRLTVAVGEVDNTFQLQSQHLFISGLKMKLQESEEDKAETKQQADADRAATIIDRAEMFIEVLDNVKDWVRLFSEQRDGSGWDQWLAQDCMPWLEGV
jgi:hypothetical protein